eukprot:jgi/Picre1/34774/NNA_002240.t1
MMRLAYGNDAAAWFIADSIPIGIAWIWIITDVAIRRIWIITNNAITGSGSLSDPMPVLPPAPHASETNLEALATNFDRVLEGVTKGQHQGTRALPWTLQVKSVPTEGGKLWLYENLLHMEQFFQSP